MARLRGLRSDPPAARSNFMHRHKILKRPFITQIDISFRRHTPRIGTLLLVSSKSHTKDIPVKE